jgi:hypothetical protein
MKRFLWITDIHLNFVGQAGAANFLGELAAVEADGILLSGDIGEAPDVTLYLNALNSALGRPIYFVLGNHDFYRGTIAGVRRKVEELCAACPNLCWLPLAGVVALTESTGLIGQDGWGDGHLGDYWGLAVHLNDWRFIGEFIGLDVAQRLDKLHALGDEAAAHFAAVLPEALARFRHLIVVTHVPPFREACWYDGRISDDDWLPHFTCKAVGDVLAQAMTAHPDRQMTVLCGHTHGAGEAQVLPNLRVLTGGAVYGKPALQRVLELA